MEDKQEKLTADEQVLEPTPTTKHQPLAEEMVDNQTVNLEKTAVGEVIVEEVSQEEMAPETPLAVLVTPENRNEEENQATKSKKSSVFFGKNKGIIAATLIASLCGGLIGGGLVGAMLYDGNGLQIPNNAAPIQIEGGLTSPVVAIAETVGPAVVGISNMATGQDWFGRQMSGQQGSGSGVIFREDGYIVTNNHVIKGASSLIVSLADGRDVEATVIGADEATDLAVIKIEADNLTVASFGDSDALQVGELVVAIGNPLGSDFARTVTDGIVSGKDRTLKVGDQTYQLLQTNAAINSGNSGGALVNSTGQVIGINSVKVEQAGVEGLGFAIPINEAKPIIEELMNNGYVSRPYMGISGGTVDESLANRYQLPVKHGVFVSEVQSGGPANKAGLMPGDIIYKLDGEILQDMDQLSETLATHKAGDSMNLLVDRNGEPKEITLVLGEEKDQPKTVQQPQQQQSIQQFIFPFGN